MRRLAAAFLALIALALAGCSAVPATAEHQPSPPASASSRPVAFTTETAEYQACVKLYSETDDRDYAFNKCGRLAQSDREAAAELFGDQTWIEKERARRMFEKGGTGPYLLLDFTGDGGAATVTIGQGAGSIVQRQVTLPYSEQVPVGTVVTNVLEANSSVGCRITSFSEEHPAGVVLDERPAVEGQTLAQCASR